MGSEDVWQFLSNLANNKHVAVNTQKIALNALAFLYNKFLQQPLDDIDTNINKDVIYLKSV